MTAASVATWRPSAGVIAVAAGMVTVAVRAWHLDTPGVFVFDEVFYANDALDLLDHGVELDRPVHPPLGKWLIAGGVRRFGFTPVGWRVAPLLAGGATVALACLVGAHLTRSRLAGALAAVLVATDGVAVTTGRLALLDGLVAPFVLVALLLALHFPGATGRRSWLLAAGAGAAAGAATAVKWSGGPIVVLVVVAAAMALGGTVPRRALAALVVVGVAGGAYLGAWTGWFVDPGAGCPERRPCGGSAVTSLVDDHVRSARFHRRLDPTNRFTTSAWRWATEPVVLFERVAEEREARVVALPNPLLAVAGGVAVAVLAGCAVRRRRSDAALVVGAAAGLWLPWALSEREGFSFYAAPLVPVLAVAAVAAGWTNATGRKAVVVLTAASLALFLLWWPVLSGDPISPGWAETILPLDSWRGR